MNSEDRVRIVINNPDSRQGEIYLAFALLEALDKIGSLQRRLEYLETLLKEDVDA